MIYTFAECPSNNQTSDGKGVLDSKGATLSSKRATFGGKGATLARLYQAGYPVPNGFIITPNAFTGETINTSVWAQVLNHIQQLQNGNPTITKFAIRSSATSEDSAHASFAGEFETVLGVQTEAEIQAAIQQVYRSRHSQRVQAYSQAQQLNDRHQLAVIVQKQVPAELSGVLFTADPITGSHRHMVGNYVHGLGDALVSGEVNPETFSLQRPNGRYHGHKTLKSYGRKLFRLAQRLEADLKAPQDIEWAIADGQLYILQARPITTMQPYNPKTGAWNHSFTGDYLWTNTNFGEALPEVMTPLTWSMMQHYFKVNGIGIETEQIPLAGNIGGRLYLNASLFLSLTDALHLPRRKMQRLLAEAFGHLPENIDIATLPLPLWHTIRQIVPHIWQRMRDVQAWKKEVPNFITNAPQLAQKLTTQIKACDTPTALTILWRHTLLTHLEDTMRLLAAGTSDYKRLLRQLHPKLNKLIGEAHTNTLLTSASTHEDHLDSLGPLIGLTKVAHGELTRADYLAQYGHRSANELELAAPHPAENPTWLDEQLTTLTDTDVDAMSLLVTQSKKREAAWQQLCQQHPRQANKLASKLQQLARASRTRERARSAVVHMFTVFRNYALQAGKLTGLEEDIFFLSFSEIIALLEGDKTVTAVISPRRATYQQQRALPPYPPIINGRFDPVQWAANPNRRHDLYDANTPNAFTNEEATAEETTTIRGFAGAPGIVEGMVRRIDHPEEGHQLQAGEVLVTAVTNIGWTPLFPKAAAIVTDVGAPLSHAAVVARELGLTAVVGCGNATTYLHTGDRVRVNGGAGIVERLKT